MKDSGPIEILPFKAQQILKLFKKDPLEAERRFNALPFIEKVALVLSVRGKDRERLILLSKEPERLVQRMPEEEFYYTLKEIGERDALTLLELASPKQIAFCLDLEVWKKNRLKPQEMLKWIELLLDCDEERAVEAFRNLDQELLITLLQRYLKVYKPDAPIEEVELDRDDLFTLDHHYYIRVKFKQAEELIERFLDLLFRWDQALYRDLLEGVIWEVPGEVEELARRWRQGRLSDKGFPEWEEAMEIYSFVNPELVDIDKGIKDSYGPDEEMKRWQEVGSNFYLLPLPKGSFLKEVLEEASRQGLDWIRGEIVLLCNKAMVAENVDPSNLEAVRELLLRVYDYLNLGLSFLSKGDPKEALRAVRKLYLKEIFQLGYSLTVRLRHKLERTLRESPWFEGKKPRLSWLDPPLREFADGLLRKKPMLFEGVVEPRGVNYRPFRTLEEIYLAEELIADIKAIAELHFSVYGLKPSDEGETRKGGRELTFKGLTLTAIANKEVKGEFFPDTLNLKELRAFLEEAFVVEGQRLGNALKGAFVTRTVAFFEEILSPVEPKQRERMKRFLHETLNDLLDEYQGLDLEGLDPRFLKWFMLKES